MSILGTQERPLRVAVVGSGPSGFFAADHLLKSLVVCEVNLFERLPVPFGLVRGGVAPDHPKIRTVTKVFERTAAHPRFAFFGNVEIGRDLSLEELRRFHDAVILAYGAEADQRMGIPGEDLPGSHTATEFVGWYNAHPDFRDARFDLSKETAVIVGAGNVALDVARILCLPPEALAATDIAGHALDALAESRVRDVVLLVRRGPAQVKFTLSELKEIGDIPGCQPVVDPAELALNPESAEEINTPELARILEILGEFAARPADPAARRRIHFRFLAGPHALEGEGEVERIVLERNRLAGPAFHQKPWATGETFALDCGLVFRSIGYRGLPLPGAPFHEKGGVVPNTLGCVEDNGRTVPGLYAAGWIKRGPTGVIGTNKADSLETVKSVLTDTAGLAPCPEPDTEALRALLRARGVRAVSFDDWRVIDAAEQARGAVLGKPRERFTRVAEMLAALDNAARAGGDTA